MDYSSSEDDSSIENLTDLDEEDRQEQDNNISIPIQNDISDAKTVYQEPYLGMEFDSDSSARSFYTAYALKLGFGIRVARSRTERRKGVETLVMKRFVCLKEGHHKKKNDQESKKRRKRISIRDGCPALMEVVRRGLDKWVVCKLVLEHTHVVASPYQICELQQNEGSSKEKETEERVVEMRRKVFGGGDCQILLDYFKKMQLKNNGFFYSVKLDGMNCVTNAVWIDAKARVWYTYFGDAVTFDTSFMQNRIAVFTGKNHHNELVIFGYALVLDKSVLGLVWVFETWLMGMNKRYPISLTTDYGKNISNAISRVFPQTYHRFCRWRIFSRCKKKLSDIYPKFPSLHEEIKRCINEADTVDIYEIYWRSIVEKFDLRENEWLGFLYEIRNKWVPAYLTGSFFAELATDKRAESINRFYRYHFGTNKVSLIGFITKFDELMETMCEKEEARSEMTILPSDRVLKTDMIMEKQAVEIYTRQAFLIFQTELVESLNHFAVKIQEGPYCKYSVERVGETRTRYRHTVYFSMGEKKAWCDCNKFAFFGILCRHVLAVFLLTGLILLPDHCVMRRWTRKAKMGPDLEERDGENERLCERDVVLRYNDLVRDLMRCVEKGAVSTESFRVVKGVVRKALGEIRGFEERSGICGDRNSDRVLEQRTDCEF
ncbi:hypothetical protein LUZ60_009418 [Juncus effusus]|nr:hypothetical protein LUZ60_009418 [Juncus effusus]